MLVYMKFKTVYTNINKLKVYHQIHGDANTNYTKSNQDSSLMKKEFDENQEIANHT